MTENNLAKSNNQTQDKEMPIAEHFLELRNRFLKSLTFVFLIFVCLLPFSQDIYTLASLPIQKYLPENATMIATGVISPFLTPFKLTLIVCLYLSAPFWLFQIYSFIAPALYKEEKRLITPLILLSTILFYLGIIFAYFVVMPLVFSFVSASSPKGTVFMPDIAQYLDFMMTLFFAFGVSFEIPILVIILLKSKIIDANKLSQMRPFIIIACFVIGMFLTPPDVISQSLLAIPMWLLFELGLMLGNKLK